jgi:hypothetical protein
MLKLVLPPIEAKYKQENDKTYIFDILRKKYLFLTPEEWVRQHLIHLLINQYQYPKSLISCEKSLSYNKRLKRTDIVTYDQSGNPFLLIECKAPNIKLSKNTLHQASTYNSQLKAPFLCISNGINTLCFQINHKTQEITQLKDLPHFLSQ